jgi:cytochrome c oxidase subunit III
MKIGTAEPVPEVEEIIKPRTGLSGSTSAGSGNGGGGGGPDGGDGPDRPGPQALDSGDAPYSDKSKYIAWFLLMAVGMTFAGLLGAYLMIATNKAAEWKPFELPVQVWISTAIIIASSITYSLAKRGIDRDEFLTARNWLLATAVLGALFISSQFVLWIVLSDRGLYMSGNPYAGFFYILTAAHVVHVAGGIVALGSIVIKSWVPVASEHDSTRRRDLARSVGWYWHFMGGLWVVLLLMLGFWR